MSKTDLLPPPGHPALPQLPRYLNPDDWVAKRETLRVLIDTARAKGDYGMEQLLRLYSALSEGVVEIDKTLRLFPHPTRAVEARTRETRRIHTQVHERIVRAQQDAAAAHAAVAFNEILAGATGETVSPPSPVGNGHNEGEVR